MMIRLQFAAFTRKKKRIMVMGTMILLGTGNGDPSVINADAFEGASGDCRLND